MKHNKHAYFVLGMVWVGVWLLLGCGRAPRTTTADAPATFVADTIAYVPFGNHIRVVDVADPRLPVVVGSYIASGLVFQVQVVGDWLIASQYGGYDPVLGADTNSAVLVLSLDDPHQPELVVTLPLAQAPQAMLWQGTYLYISDWESTAVYNMAAPANPVLLTTWPERFDNFTTADNTLYASRADCNFRTGWCRSALREIPLPPTADLGLLHEFSALPIWRTQAKGDYLYVVGQTLAAVPRHDLANLPAYTGQNLGAYGVLVSQTADRLYLAWASNLMAYDTADPTKLRKLYEITAASSDTYFTHMAIQGDMLYLASQYGLHIYDLAGSEAYGVGLVNFRD